MGGVEGAALWECTKPENPVGMWSEVEEVEGGGEVRGVAGMAVPNM